MFVRHRAVMGAEQPAFQERHDLMDVRQELRGRPGLPLEERDPVPVAVAPQRLVAEPPIGVHATPGGNGRLNEGHQAPRRRIDKSPQPDAPEATAVEFHGNSHERFGFRLAATSSRVHAADIRFIHLDVSRQRIAAGADHRPSQLMQPGPGGFVAAQTQGALQTQGADPRFLVRDPPHRAEPRRQRRAGVLKDRTGRDRGLMPTGRTVPQPTSSGRPRLLAPTARAPKSVGPAHLSQVPAARLVGREPPVEFAEIPRKILHGPGHYMWGPLESSK